MYLETGRRGEVARENGWSAHGPHAKSWSRALTPQKKIHLGTTGEVPAALVSRCLRDRCNPAASTGRLCIRAPEAPSSRVAVGYIKREHPTDVSVNVPVSSSRRDGCPSVPQSQRSVKASIAVRRSAEGHEPSLVGGWVFPCGIGSRIASALGRPRFQFVGRVHHATAELAKLWPAAHHSKLF